MRFLSLLALSLALTLAACDSADPGLNAASGSSSMPLDRATANGQTRVPVCHQTSSDSNDYVLIEVAEPAYETHVAHGDASPFAGVPGTEREGGGFYFTFGGSCELVEVVEVPDPISSTFESGVNDGWTTLSDPFSYLLIRVSNGQYFLWYDEDGNEGTHDFFVAPSKFTGDLSAYYGGSLSYRIRPTDLTNRRQEDDFVQLSGGGITLVYRSTNLTTSTWNLLDIALDETAGWQVATTGSFNFATGTTLATQAQIQQVLADVTALRIRADYRSGAESNSLDDVVIQATD